MGMFQNLTTDDLEETGDRLGGFGAVESGVYDATIQVAYVSTSPDEDSKSMWITVVAKAGNQEIKERVLIAGREGQNFYTDKKDPKKKIPLQGYTTINDLCLLITGYPLVEQDTEEKIVKIYNFTEKKELPTPVQVLTALTGQPTKLGILRQVVDKQKLDKNSGEYVNTGDTRTENTIDKVFHAETGRTVTEYQHEVDPAEFLPEWEKRNKGRDRNRAKGANGGGNGASGEGRPGGGKSAKTSLFGKK